MRGNEILVMWKTRAEHFKKHTLQPRMKKQFRFFNECQKVFGLSHEKREGQDENRLNAVAEIVNRLFLLIPDFYCKRPS